MYMPTCVLNLIILWTSRGIAFLSEDMTTNDKLLYRNMRGADLVRGRGAKGGARGGGKGREEGEEGEGEEGGGGRGEQK